MHLLGREKPLTIIAPPGLSEIVTTQTRISESIFNYSLNIIECNTETYFRILEFEDIEVYTIPLAHRIKCCGYLFREKPKKRRLINARLPENITLLQRAALRNGEDIKDEAGNILHKNEDLTLPPKKSFSYAYCTDTAYTESIVPYLQNIDLLYHEATFLNAHLQRATDTYHSTAEQAAIIASKANAGALLIGHFSSRYKDLEPFLEEACKIFPNTQLAKEGDWHILKEEHEHI